MSVEEFWGPGSQRDKLVDFYRAIKNRDSYTTRSLADKAKLIKVRDLAKVLIEHYNTQPGQLKSMLESAEWSPDYIDSVLCQNQ